MIFLQAKAAEVESIVAEVKHKYSKTPTIYCFKAVSGAKIIQV